MARPLAGGEIILAARGLTKEFRGFTAVDGVDLTIQAGSTHAIIGPRGAGKSTLFNLLTKFLQPSHGSILYRNEDISRASAAQVLRMGLVRSLCSSSSPPDLSVLDTVRLALQRPRHLARQWWRSAASVDLLNARAMELLEAMELAESTGLKAGELSPGHRRALELATALALDPDLMLLDEPLAGLGHEDVARVTALIRRAGRNRTVLMVERNLGMVAPLCDTVTVLARGAVVTEGTPEKVRRDPRVREAYLRSETNDA